MKRTKRIVKRTAALMLCAVVLFMCLPVYMPQAQAAAAILPTLIEIQQLMQIAELYSAYGALQSMGKSSNQQFDGVVWQKELDRVKAQVEKEEEITGITAENITKIMLRMAMSGVTIKTTNWESTYNAVLQSGVYDEWLGTDEGARLTNRMVTNVNKLRDFANSVDTEIALNLTPDYDYKNKPVTEIIYDNLQASVAWLVGLFGSSSGTAAIKALSIHETLDMVNAAYIGELMHGPWKVNKYKVPIGTYIYDGVQGQYLKTTALENYKVDVDIKRCLWQGNVTAGYLIVGYEERKAVYNWGGQLCIYIDIYEDEPNNGVMSNKNCVSIYVSWDTNDEYLNQIAGIYGINVTKGAIGLPEVPYSNAIPEVSSALDDTDKDIIPIYFPNIPITDGDTPWEKLNKVINELETFDPVAALTEPEVEDPPTEEDEDLRQLCLEELGKHLEKIGVSIPQTDDEDWQEKLRKQKAYLDWINQRLRDGAGTAGLLQRLWELLQRLKGALSLIGEEYAAALEQEHSEVENIARALGYTDTGEIPFEMEGFVLPDVTKKFPFCIPFDLIACLTVLNATSETPKFTIPFVVPVIDFRQDIEIDLSAFEDVVAIIRWLETLLFIFGLALITRNVIRG